MDRERININGNYAKTTKEVETFKAFAEDEKN
jgi:hypothetical protein